MPPKVLGVLAGQDMPSELIQKWAESADVLLAADYGADVLLELGIHPDHVVGDLDSTLKIEELRRLVEEEILRVSHDPSQERTDCDKLLSLAESLEYEEITLAAVEGDQLDHMLATLHSAARSPLRVRVALRNGIGWLLRDGEEARAATKPGRRVSLLPLTPTEGASLRGVEWPLERSALDPLGKTSISNRADGNEVKARVFEGAAFLFVEFPPEEMPVW